MSISEKNKRIHREIVDYILDKYDDEIKILSGKSTDKKNKQHILIDIELEEKSYSKIAEELLVKMMDKFYFHGREETSEGDRYVISSGHQREVEITEDEWDYLDGIYKVYFT